ncbi:uncharacterized protein LOC101864057 isoform X2 [Aplysia californica]|uniref:Uncharacterized protein LOC101864057 isoform X2 n=1 Tax=Aplysia californica TaxID=6500 RepID=A0ABM0JKS0_APLCA|nr:uncharacterized protein LOC101864057 isoform X2 [Aplysia californica]
MSRFLNWRTWTNIRNYTMFHLSSSTLFLLLLPSAILAHRGQWHHDDEYQYNGDGDDYDWGNEYHNDNDLDDGYDYDNGNYYDNGKGCDYDCNETTTPAPSGPVVPQLPSDCSQLYAVCAVINGGANGSSLGQPPNANQTGNNTQGRKLSLAGAQQDAVANSRFQALIKICEAQTSLYASNCACALLPSACRDQRFRALASCSAYLTTIARRPGCIFGNPNPPTPVEHPPSLVVPIPAPIPVEQPPSPLVPIPVSVPVGQQPPSPGTSIPVGQGQQPPSPAVPVPVAQQPPFLPLFDAARQELCAQAGDAINTDPSLMILCRAGPVLLARK